MRGKAAFLLPFLWLVPAEAASMRDNYENCVAASFITLRVNGAYPSPPVAEQAIRSCETELQALYGLLVGTNMDPKQAVSMISSIRLSAKRRLLQTQ